MSSAVDVRKYYQFIDGLRGACALYVVLSHACAMVDQTLVNPVYAFSFISQFILTVFSFGHMAVGFFIVISGFCIFSAGQNTGSPRLVGGPIAYAKARIRRILPPYVACLSLYYLIVWMRPELQLPSHSRWDDALPIFKWDVLLSHLFLIHNFSNQWLFKIDPPMWSLGIEWWIYWITPIFVLPIWKKYGTAVGVLTGFIYGFAISLGGLMPENACSWYIGLFCLGAAVSSVRNTTSPAMKLRLGKANWSLGFLLFLGIAILDSLLNRVTWRSDCLVGLSAFCALISGLHESTWLNRVLASKPLTTLGQFSYSLYLFHWIVLTMIHNYGLSLKLSPDQITAWNLLVGVPVAVIASYIFFLFFERPMLRKAPVFQSVSINNAEESQKDYRAAG